MSSSFSTQYTPEALVWCGSARWTRVRVSARASSLSRSTSSTSRAFILRVILSFCSIRSLFAFGSRTRMTAFLLSFLSDCVHHPQNITNSHGHARPQCLNTRTRAKPLMETQASCRPSWRLSAAKNASSRFLPEPSLRHAVLSARTPKQSWFRCSKGRGRIWHLRVTLLIRPTKSVLDANLHLVCICIQAVLDGVTRTRRIIRPAHVAAPAHAPPNEVWIHACIALWAQNKGIAGV